MIQTNIDAIIKKYREERISAWEHYRQLCNKVQQEISELINFKGKYLRIYQDYEPDIYLFVREQYVLNNQEKSEYQIILNGIGLKMYSGGDNDHVFGEFDKDFQHIIGLVNINNELQFIDELTREEFIKEVSKAFDIAKEKIIEAI